MAEKQKEKVCTPTRKLIFACSGAADVGEITDKAARKLDKDGAGKMFCLAGIGGKVGPILKATQTASRLLAIDGCSFDCVKNCLEHGGFYDYQHIRVTDLGMEKGKSSATARRVNTVASKAKELLS